MDWYLEVIKKCAVFEGRAGRKEYWFFILFNILISYFMVLDSKPETNEYGPFPKVNMV